MRGNSAPKLFSCDKGTYIWLGPFWKFITVDGANANRNARERNFVLFGALHICRSE